MRNVVLKMDMSLDGLVGPLDEDAEWIIASGAPLFGGRLDLRLVSSQGLSAQPARVAAMVSRDAQEADIVAIAWFFRAIVAAGESYAYPEDLDDGGHRGPVDRSAARSHRRGRGRGWDGPRQRQHGTQRPGRGAHIATASFLVDPGRRAAESFVRSASRRCPGLASRASTACS
jgi:hypothetical protein